jgi:ectoine hydrolase
MRKAGKIVETHACRRIFDENVEPGCASATSWPISMTPRLRYDDELGFGGDYPAIVPLLPSGADAAAPHLTWDDKKMVTGEGPFSR